jgi:hypothetical protein
MYLRILDDYFYTYTAIVSWICAMGRDDIPYAEGNLPYATTIRWAPVI